MKLIHSESPLFRLPEEDLAAFYRDGDFKPPEHRYNGRKPKIAVIFDDCLGSAVYSKPRKLNGLATYSRHVGQLKEGGAIGVSLFFFRSRCEHCSDQISERFLIRIWFIL